MIRLTLTALSVSATSRVFQNTDCTFKLSNHIASIQFNRPQRKNAIGRQFLTDLSNCITYCHDMAQQDKVRAILVSSALKDVFCAGADLKERKEMTPEETRVFVNLLRNTICALEDLPVPTISAIEGVALGGGLEIALATDIRIAGSAAKLGLTETSLAIIPGAGGSQRLTRLIGLSKAKEMIFTAVPVKAHEAVTFGLINRCVEAGTALAHAQEMAERISGNGPIAVKAAKAAMVEGYDLGRGEAMAAEQKYYDVVLRTEDRLEGLAAFKEKRLPVYLGK